MICSVYDVRLDTVHLCHSSDMTWIELTGNANTLDT